MPLCYSTQTTLADAIATEHYPTFYVYITSQFAMPGNYPRSNPQWIHQVWCQVAAGQVVKDEEGNDLWREHKQTLKRVAQLRLIDEATQSAVVKLIATADSADARPVVYEVSVDAWPPSESLPGNSFAEYPHNDERILDSLKAVDINRVYYPCASPAIPT